MSIFLSILRIRPHEYTDHHVISNQLLGTKVERGMSTGYFISLPFRNDGRFVSLFTVPV